MIGYAHLSREQLIESKDVICYLLLIFFSFLSIVFNYMSSSFTFLTLSLLISQIWTSACTLFSIYLTVGQKYEVLPIAFRRASTIIVLHVLGVLLTLAISIGVLINEPPDEGKTKLSACFGILVSFMLFFKLLMHSVQSGKTVINF
ncbi:hypothetical protein RF11_07968 [Thelohanellus kitauei]|uniref:Uncharacterized protein n=1 Tax=Thelohanellus kitauei TaxID=669202 RepID=A0A0C2J1L5_THEKT|nr:hypothetical protein RF11_07968 [Thelohanellus kitauei]